MTLFNNSGTVENGTATSFGATYDGNNQIRLDFGISCTSSDDMVQIYLNLK